jgi:hypothetical protein
MRVNGSITVSAADLDDIRLSSQGECFVVNGEDMFLYVGDMFSDKADDVIRAWFHAGRLMEDALASHRAKEAAKAKQPVREVA